MIGSSDVIRALGKAMTRFEPSGPGEDSFTGVVVDSRKATAGSLFVAMRGANTDGHEFVCDALQRGARGLLVERDVDPGHSSARPAILRVDNTLEALQKLAAFWRKKHVVRLTAVTGSVGKSSTKELIASVLSTRFRVLKNEGNLNTEIGLPMVLLGIESSIQKVVLEMGMYAPGEICQLCEIAQPEIGVVTNVGHSHLGRLGTVEAIADAKAELIESLPKSGTAVLNGDDPLVRAMAARTSAEVLLYGINPAMDVWADRLESRGLEGNSFVLHHRNSQLRVNVRLLGRHSVHTALAAAAVGLAEGLTLQEIAFGLEAAREFRLLPMPGLRGSTIIDDTYNASPASTLAALGLLAEVQGRKIAVLGDMRELGAYEIEGHLKVGRRAAEVADILVVLGEKAALAGKEAEQAGARVIFTTSREEASARLASLLEEGDVVLVKGSRAIGMEEIVERLKQA